MDCALLSGEAAGAISCAKAEDVSAAPAPAASRIVLNVKTANALGISLPDALTARADEVIE